jgi:hypothetical protein
MIFGSFRNTAIAATALVISLGFSTASLADDDDHHKKLTPEDAAVKTIFDKSVIHGSIRKDDAGNMVVDNGKLLFDYTGEIYSVKTDEETGELVKMKEQIGNIEGTAAFPVDFAFLSAGFKAIMGLLEAGYSLQDAMGMVGVTQLPPILDWTCNHCKMVIGKNTYVNIVDVLTEGNDYYNADMAAKFNGMLVGGAEGGKENMRLQARAFLGLTPTAMDVVAKEMSIRMAGCSAIVGVAGPNAGMVGTLCLNSVATFNVSGTNLPTEANPNGPITNNSSITGEGTSNCVTVLHYPTM